MIGAGGVGSAIAVAADDVGGPRPRRRHRPRRRPGESRDRRSRRDALRRPGARRVRSRRDRGACARRAVDVIVNACDPRLNPPIFAAAFDAGCHYLDMAMTLSEPHPERPYELPGPHARRGAVRRVRPLEGARTARAGRHGRGARPLRRVRALRRRPPVLDDRRDRRARRRRPRGRRLRLRADVLDLDHHRGVPEPAARVGARPRVLHAARRSRSRRRSCSPRASARSSACTSSTKRCC